MRSSGIRLGEKFVFEDKGGVWEKVGDGRARCVFGNRDDYGREIDIVQDCFVYVIFDRPKPDRRNQVQGGVRVILMDEENDAVVAEYEDVSPAMVAAIAAADEMAARPYRKRKRRYLVMDTAVDVDENAVCVLVRGAESIGGGDEREDGERLGGRRAGGVSVEGRRNGSGDKGDVSRVPEVRQEAGAEGQDMGGVRSGGDVFDRGVPPVQDTARVEGEALPGQGNTNGARDERRVEEDADGADVFEV